MKTIQTLNALIVLSFAAPAFAASNERFIVGPSGIDCRQLAQDKKLVGRERKDFLAECVVEQHKKLQNSPEYQADKAALLACKDRHQNLYGKPEWVEAMRQCLEGDRPTKN